MPGEYRYFKLDEFMCPCGCRLNLINKNFVTLLDRLRGMCNFPFQINSGYRCPAHNAAVGSTSENHTSGLAADIRILSDYERHELLYRALDQGVHRIGVGPRYVHLDIMDKNHAIWIYDA